MLVDNKLIKLNRIRLNPDSPKTTLSTGTGKDIYVLKIKHLHSEQLMIITFTNCFENYYGLNIPFMSGKFLINMSEVYKDQFFGENEFETSLERGSIAFKTINWDNYKQK